MRYYILPNKQKSEIAKAFVWHDASIYYCKMRLKINSCRQSLYHHLSFSTPLFHMRRTFRTGICPSLLLVLPISARSYRPHVTITKIILKMDTVKLVVFEKFQLEQLERYIVNTPYIIDTILADLCLKV